MTLFGCTACAPRRAALCQSPPRSIQQYVAYQYVKMCGFRGFVTSLQIALKQPPVCGGSKCWRNWGSLYRLSDSSRKHEMFWASFTWKNALPDVQMLSLPVVQAQSYWHKTGYIWPTGCFASSKTKLTLIIFRPSLYRAANTLKTSYLKLYREIIAVCFQIHAKHIGLIGNAWEESGNFWRLNMGVHKVITGL